MTSVTRSTTQNIPTTNQCKNGGTPDKEICICPSNFIGNLCENPVDSIKVEKLNRTVEVSIKISNQEFTENLTNKTSPDFKKFETDFKMRMNAVYKTISGYKDVYIRNVSNGSIVVDHDVNVETSFSDRETEYNMTYNNIRSALQDAVDNCTDAADEFCFSSNFTVNEINLEDKDLCKLFVAEELAIFYEPSGAACVSVCSPQHHNPHKCHSINGRCILQTKGPTCYCEHSDTYLYTGTYCEIQIHKVGLYVGVSIAVVVLIAFIITLAIFLYYHQDQKKIEQNTRQSHEDLIENMFEDDWEWHALEGFKIPSANTLNWGDNKSCESSVRTSQSNFTPTLDKVDTNIEVKIQRPQVKLS